GIVVKAAIGGENMQMGIKILKIAKSQSGTDNGRPRQLPIVQNDLRRSGNRRLHSGYVFDKHRCKYLLKFRTPNGARCSIWCGVNKIFWKNNAAISLNRYP
ncbi:hypothetical protein LCGC14_1913860, partial [marine sediment metagenome]